MLRPNSISLTSMFFLCSHTKRVAPVIVRMKVRLFKATLQIGGVCAKCTFQFCSAVI